VAPPSDIVVVGAGVVGCAVAYELARRGASVKLVDDRPAGMGATQASAGMLAPFNEAPDDGPLLELTARGLDVFDGFLAQLAEDTHAILNYHRTGTLAVAVHSDALQQLERTHARLRNRGVLSELLDSSTLGSEEPQLTESAIGGLLIPSHGFVGASDLTRAMADGARHHGAHFIEDRRVHRVYRADGETRVQTEQGSLSSDAVVLAAGSWTGGIQVEGAVRLPVAPIRGQLLQLMWTGPTLRRVIWGERCYLVPWQDGTVLVGATLENVGFDERTTIAGVGELITAVCELVPQATTATFVGARAGLRPATPDHLPTIGRSQTLPNVVYATGHYRNGVLLAPLTAKLVADLLLDGRADPMLGPLSPQRFGHL
jgi:glycine oxidase